MKITRQPKDERNQNQRADNFRNAKQIGPMSEGQGLLFVQRRFPMRDQVEIRHEG